MQEKSEKTFYKYLTLLPRLIWKVYLFLNFLTGLILLYPFFALLLKNEKHYSKAFALMRLWAKQIAFTSGIIVLVKGKHHLKNSKAAIYCSNHNSYLDILIAYVAIPHYFVFIGKREIEGMPMMNIFFKGMNILVDRSSRIDSHKALQLASEEITKGNNLFIFPEGGIYYKSANMRPFKNGAFKLAIEKQIPVVPVTFCNNFKILQTGSFFLAHAKPGIVHVVVHPPVDAADYTHKNMRDLKDKVYNQIKSAL